jgi:hypothetical protein
MITVGGLSVAVTRALRTSPDGVEGRPPIAPESTIAVSPPVGAQDTTTPAVPESLRAPSAPSTPRTAPAPRPKAQLAFSGGVDDLDRAAFEALMGALDEIDRGPVVPSAEPGRVSALPIISDETR